MADLLNIWIGSQIVARGEIRLVRNDRGETVYSLQIKETIRMPEEPTRRRGRRRSGPRLIERFLDPERDHPILRQLLQALAPMLLQFLTVQLPAMLVTTEPDEDDDDGVA